MALQPQSQLGTFTVLGALGAGGMGEVYRARDTKLQRDVAIKILPEEFARDTERVHRFRREAELLAQLNHPRIAAIYDLQESHGAYFLVLELVEGETLADRIARGSLPVKQALEIAKQICEALEAAHDKSIVHRDLKPANIKLQADGTIKVLDFGLAKTTENTSVNSNLTHSPTMFTVAGTKMGLIMGTAPLHGSGAGERLCGGSSCRHLCVWLRVVRNAERQGQMGGDFSPTALTHDLRLETDDRLNSLN